MPHETTLLNGAFKATFEKGRWKYTPTFKSLKKTEKTSVKEPPQYSVLLEIEKAASDRFKLTSFEMSKQIAIFITKI